MSYNAIKVFNLNTDAGRGADLKRHRLRQARHSIHYTQAQVAEYLNMTIHAYRAIELGTRGTTQKNWLNLFNLFNQNIPLDKLMETTPFPLPTVTEDIQNGIA